VNGEKEKQRGEKDKKRAGVNVARVSVRRKE
jgi:hypothetical protein